MLQKITLSPVPTKSSQMGKHKSSVNATPKPHFRISMYTRNDQQSEFRLRESDSNRSFWHPLAAETAQLTKIHLIHDVNHYWALVPKDDASLAYGNGEGRCVGCCDPKLV